MNGSWTGECAVEIAKEIAVRDQRNDIRNCIESPAG